MKNKYAEEIRKQHTKEFNYNKNLRKATENQKPFYMIQGEILNVLVWRN